MTIQVRPVADAHKSKAHLLKALKEGTARFYDPSPFNGRGNFSASSIENGEKFAVVMDPQTRRRFATVSRGTDGTFKVS